MGGAFVHHDGGMEESASLLPGLIGRADLVLFPVDFVSHDAALAVKRFCKQADKRYVPLPRAGHLEPVARVGKAVMPARRRMNEVPFPQAVRG